MTADATWYAIQGPNGDLTWRVESPAHAVGAKVNMIPDDTGFEALHWPNTHTAFPWAMNVTFPDGGRARIASEDHWKRIASSKTGLVERTIDHLAHEGDAAVWTRPLAWGAAHMMEMRNQGIRVAAEVDDNYLSAQRLNVFMQKAGWGENDRDAHIRSVCVGDALILSTQWLRDAYWKGLSKQFGKRELPDLFVCRNHVDPRFVPTPPPHDGRLRVGYMGSDSHIWDVDLIFDALMAAQAEGCEIVFVGIHPALLNPRFSRSRKPWHKLPYTHIPWRNEGFRGNALPIDIGLAPLRIDHHTLGKSDIKALEYALSGAACVAQNCEVYNRTLTSDHVRFAGSPAEYVKHTLDLVRDRTGRERLVDATREYIREERMIDDPRNVAEWREAVYG